MKNQIKLDVYGKMVAARKTQLGWKVYFIGEDGLKRPVSDLIIPSFITMEEIVGYFSDICHEWATNKTSGVFELI